MDTVDKIMRYESGEMCRDECIQFFQEIVDSGMVWTLQGSYGRTAKALIDAGLVTDHRKKKVDVKQDAAAEYIGCRARGRSVCESE